MATTNFGSKRRNLRTSPSFIALAFQNRLEDCYAYTKGLNANDPMDRNQVILSTQ